MNDIKLWSYKEDNYYTDLLLRAGGRRCMVNRVIQLVDFWILEFGKY